MTITQENNSAIMCHDVVFRVSSREYQIAVERQALRRRLGMDGLAVDLSVILREVFLEDALTADLLSAQLTLPAALPEMNAKQLARSFWDEVESQFVWDFVPFSFIWDLYMAWTRDRQVPSHLRLVRKTLVMTICGYVESSSRLWVSEEASVTKRPGNRLDAKEPLACDYGLAQWIDFKPKNYYRGLIRR